MTGQIIIRDADTLQEWRSAVRQAALPLALPWPEFRLPWLDEGENRRLTLEAARLHGECGCSAAGLGMTGAAIILAARLLLSGQPLGSVPALSWAVYILLIAIAATAGKVAGLLWARRQLARLAEGVVAAETLRGRRIAQQV